MLQTHVSATDTSIAGRPNRCGGMMTTRNTLSSKAWLLCAVVAIVLCPATNAADLTAEQILAKARELGGNDPRIQSGQAKLREETELPPSSPADIEDRIKKLLPEPTDAATNSKRHRAWKKSVEKFRESNQGPQVIVQEITVRFTGTPAQESLRRDERAGNAPEAAPAVVRLCGGEGDQRATLTWMRGTANVIAQPTENLVRNLGRMPASPVAQKGLFDSLIGETEAIELLDDETIDGHTCRVLAIRNRYADILQSKVWIDPARGFVCPRRETYAGKGLVTARFEASSYFKAPGTDFWIAGEASETVYNMKSELLMTKRYQLEPQSLQFNVPISAAEFVVNVEPGLTIVDHRPGGRSWRVDEATRLSFVDGRLDLASFPGMVATSAPNALPTAGFSPDDFGPVARAVLLALACVPPLLLAATIYLVRRLLLPRRGVVPMEIKTPGSVH